MSDDDQLKEGQISVDKVSQKPNIVIPQQESAAFSAQLKFHFLFVYEFSGIFKDFTPYHLSTPMKVFKISFVVILLALLAYAGWFALGAFSIIAGYGAKNLCSCVFVSDLERNEPGPGNV